VTRKSWGPEGFYGAAQTQCRSSAQASPVLYTQVS